MMVYSVQDEEGLEE